jgi:predicted nucleotidyltransferase
MSPPRIPAPLAPALASYRSKLSAAFGARFRGLRLYGSWARGEQGAESDVDLLVLIDDLTFADWREAVFLSSDVGVETDLLLSAHPCDPNRYRAPVERMESLLHTLGA